MLASADGTEVGVVDSGTILASMSTLPTETGLNIYAAETAQGTRGSPKYIRPRTTFQASLHTTGSEVARGADKMSCKPTDPTAVSAAICPINIWCHSFAPVLGEQQNRKYAPHEPGPQMTWLA